MSRILLLGCVSKKHDRPSPAADPYPSPLWSKRRNYANETGRAWFILSALHGLLDRETIIEPYDVSFADLQGQAAKKAWAARVFADLQQVADVDGTVFEFHAGLDYQRYLQPLIEAAGGVCTYPCEGLGVGEQLRWYDQHDPVVDYLTDPVNRVPAADFENRDRRQLSEAGLYAWFADDTARQVVEQRLGVECPELIYAGLTGATKWPSGKQSTATLRKRIRGQHLGGRVLSSTFVLTWVALLEPALDLRPVTGGLDDASRQRLRSWMREHLSVVALPWPDRDRLGAQEERMLGVLDPVLNLDGVDASVPHRRELRRLRTELRSRTN